LSDLIVTLTLIYTHVMTVELHFHQLIQRQASDLEVLNMW